MSDTTIIIGGGLAGLAAATALAEQGIPVTLLESRPRLGGRASSFLDRATETYIDNCQHVSMGCCTNFQKFCETVGLADFFRREPVLYFIDAEGRINRFSAGWLPAPLHLMSSFRKLTYLSGEDKRQLSLGLGALARTDPQQWAGRSFQQWLHEHGQTPATIERFWHVVLVSALSETLDHIDVGHARKVFVDAFLGHRDGWQVQIPTAPLEELYGTQLVDWLTNRGADIRLQTGVQRLILDGDTISAVELRSGERLAADHFILAVPYHRVVPLLPESLQTHASLSGLQKLESAPISSVHLWLDRPITSLPHAVFLERLSQWMFNRSALQSNSPADSGASQIESDSRSQSPHYYQIVISASRNLSGRSQEEVINDVLWELTEVWPETAQARLQHARLVTEHRAVFSPRPGVDALRPMQQSPTRNLQFAGDWTQTGWPATMEGAVRSGYLAAENVLSHTGRSVSLLQPDLQVGWLSKWLLGL